MHLINLLQTVNPWLRGERASVPPYARPELKRVLKRFLEGKNVLLVGARRLGKTVLLKQLGNELAERGFSPLYIPIDWPPFSGVGFPELLELGRERVLLLDEIQDLPNRDKTLKALSESGVRWVATGSGVSLLPGRESGPGRWVEEEVLPLSYGEFLKLRGLLPSPMAWEEYLLRGGWPEPALAPSIPEAHRLLWEEVLERVIWRDLARGRDPRVLRGLLWRIASRPGGLETGATARELGVSPATLWAYLELLEAGGLVRILRNLRKPRGAVKVYPSDPGILAALNPSPERGLHLKTAVLSCLMWKARTLRWQGEPGIRLWFWREGKKEVDFVLAKGEKVLEAYEVKLSGRPLRARFSFGVKVISGESAWREVK